MAGQHDASGEAYRSGSSPQSGQPRSWPYVRAGDRLGRYRIREFLGRGGMGRVYRADGPDGPVALKLIHPQYLRQDDFLRRFLLEAGAGKRIHHPNVVRTYGCEVVHLGADEQAMLVMEYVQGRTLMDLGKDLGRVPDAFLRDIAQGIAKGLEAIHAAGVIHRDLKPENVMITDDNRIKIMDLGVARLRSEEIRLSRTGHFVGSLMFAAPEQLSDNGVRCGPAADLYAIGLLLFVLASGDHPFPVGTAGEIINAHLNVLPKPLSETGAGVSAFLEEVTSTLLAKDPAARFPSATALRETLEAGESAEWWLARRTLRPEDGSGSTALPVQRGGPVRGRPAELRELNRCWRKALSGGGSALLITGEPGIGKTRLVDAFLEGLRLPAGSVGLAVAGATAPRPASAFARALPQLLGGPMGAEAVERFLPRASNVVRAVEAVADGNPDDLAPEVLVPPLIELVRAMCKRGPRVIVFDDLEAHSPLDHAIFRGLAGGTDGAALLLIAMARPTLSELLVDDLARLPRVRHLPLRRLDVSNAERVLGDILESRTLAGRLAPEVLPLAGGNPHFLREVVAGLKATNALSQDPAGTWRCAASPSAADIPESLRELFGQRLDVLAPATVDVLEAAAVQGETFEVGLVAAVLDVPVLHVLDALRGVGQDPRIVEGGGETRSFQPAIARAVVLERLGSEGRAELHARIARTLAGREAADANATPDIALHFLRAGLLDDAERYVLAGIHELISTYRYAEALRLTAEVAEHDAALPPELVLAAMVERAHVLELLGRMDEERDALTELTEYAEAHGLPVPPAAFDAHGRLLLVDGRIEDALEVFERQLASVSTTDDRVLEARARRNLGRVAIRSGELDRARALYERSLMVARAAEEPSEEILCHEALGLLFEAEGNTERARLHIGRRLELAARLGHLRHASRAHGTLARLARRWGRFREAQVHLDRQLALARQIGDRGGECKALRGLGALHLGRGRLADAHESLVAAERVASDAGRELDVASIWTDMALTHHLRGEETSMVHMAMRALSKAQRLRVPGLLVAAMSMAGQAAEESEQYDEALDWYHQALDRRARRLYAGGELLPLFGLARVWRARGRPDHAAAPLDQIVHVASALDLPGPRLVAEAMRAASLDSPPHRVVALMVRDVDRLTAHERFCIHLEMATATGDPLQIEEARALLESFAADVGVRAEELAGGCSLYRRIPGFGSARQAHRRAS